MTMLTVTLLSLVVAAAFGFLAWRSIRREQLRAQARIASLASAIDDASARDLSFEWPGEETAAPAAPVLFESKTEESGRRRPLLTAAAGLAAVLAVVVLIAMSGERYEDAVRPAISAPVESLELLSLRSAREGPTLAVTGLVRNRSDEPFTAITAIVSAMDSDGRTLRSASAALDALSAGHESLFVVTIPDARDVARYRVSFRDASGVIRHVDRRTDHTRAVS
jgi:hypothetical protein